MRCATSSVAMPAPGDLLGREVVLDVGLDQRVELRVRRQRLVVALLVAQLGRRRALDDRGGDQLLAGPLVDVAGEREDERLGTSLMGAKPPAESP